MKIEDKQDWVACVCVYMRTPSVGLSLSSIMGDWLSLYKNKYKHFLSTYYEPDPSLGVLHVIFLI